MTMFGPSPIPIRRIGITTEVRQAINSACQSIYKEKPFDLKVVAYGYSTLLMYSVCASSRSEIDPADVDFDSVKSAFLNSMPESGYQPIDIILGSISYLAPSSAKFLITLHT